MDGGNAFSLVRFYQHTTTVVVTKGSINPALLAQVTTFNQIKIEDETFPLYCCWECCDEEGIQCSAIS
jgi:hypothetical protein